MVQHGGRDVSIFGGRPEHTEGAGWCDQEPEVFQEVSERLAAHGYQRLMRQCREKLKKLKSDCRSIKDHNGRSGSNRRCWKWFDLMDSIYGHRPVSNGRENGQDSAGLMKEESLSTYASAEPPSSPPSSPAPPAASPAPSTTSTSSIQQHPVAGKRKRGHNADLASVLADMQAVDVLSRDQRNEHMQLLLSDALEARKQEAALGADEAAMRREEMAQTAAFNQAFLGVLEKLVSSRQV